MPKIQKIEDHASKVRGSESYRSANWKCKHCGKVYEVYYSDFQNLRAHMRRNHPIQYKPFTIEEEPEHGEFDHLSLLRA